MLITAMLTACSMCGPSQRAQVVVQYAYGQVITYLHADNPSAEDLMRAGGERERERARAPIITVEPTIPLDERSIITR